MAVISVRNAYGTSDDHTRRYNRGRQCQSDSGLLSASRLQFSSRVDSRHYCF